MKNTFSLKFLISFSLALVISFVSQSQITISPCAKLSPIHVVVIGSSTAAGAGPSSSDSTWVNRYRKYLQNINHANQVTNLAVGGTTTYHIMPSWFATPSGKPAITPAKNVTMALSLNPDAIIVNMPSNDGANGFGVNEQMSNFITLFNEADTAGVQLWVCTTQPKNTNAAKKLIQTQVRDSITNYFGNYAIDFWTTLANSTDGIDTLYDSGDGTHVNDAAHRILFNRVIAKGIINHVSDTLSFADHVLHDIFLENYSACGDSNTTINAVIANIGSNATSSLSINFELRNVGSSVPTTSTLPVSQINSCELDTVTLVVNTINSVDFTVNAYLVGTDSIKMNDTSQFLRVSTLGHPSIYTFNDTVCLGDSGSLSTYSNFSSDSILWYDSLVGGNIIGYGNDLSFSSVLSSKTYFSEVVRGDLFYKESLYTTNDASTNWNGLMFNIVANDTLTIDSLMVNIFSTGTQTIIGLYRMNSYLGNEASSSGWNTWGTKTLSVAAAGDFKTIDFSSIILNPNDTLGVYLYMQNSSSQLSYQNSGGGTDFADSNLQILKGTGIAHTYGTAYYPRNFSGEVFYHYGFRPEGDCSSGREPVSLVLSVPDYQFGNDTVLALSESLTLGSTTSGNTYLWSNSATSAQITIDTANFSIGANTIWLQTTDASGCVFYDTIIVTFLNTVSLTENDFLSVHLYPNPSNNGIVNIDGLKRDTRIEVRNVNGKVLYNRIYNDTPLNLQGISKGMYFVTFYQNEKSITKKLVLN